MCSLILPESRNNRPYAIVVLHQRLVAPSCLASPRISDWRAQIHPPHEKANPRYIRSVGGHQSRGDSSDIDRHCKCLFISSRGKVARINHLQRNGQHTGVWHAPCLDPKCEKQGSSVSWQSLKELRHRSNKEEI